MLINADLVARRINPSDKDAFLGTCLEVESLFVKETGYEWETAEDKEYTFSNNVLRLKSFPCRLKNAVLVSIQHAGVDGVFEDISDTTMIFEDSLHKTSGVFKKYIKYIVTGGYTWEEMPADIKEAFVKQIEYSLIRNSKEKIAQRFQNIERDSAQYGGSYHPSFQQAINRYRLYSIS